MISIFLNDNELELYEDSNIVWQWTAFRFEEKIRDAFTNNFTIPKSMNNIKTLGIYSLLEEKEQFWGRLQPAVLYMGDEVFPSYIQVVGVTDTDIEIAIYEDRLIYTLKNKKFSDFFKDNPITIFEWNRETLNMYPRDFIKYNYGAPYSTKPISQLLPNVNAQYAQLHPIKPLNEILQSISTQTNINIQPIDNSLLLMASKKIVCPQNTTQVIQFGSDGETLNNNLFDCVGGQHICNDLSKNAIQEITFNRDCDVAMDIFTIWSRKAAWQYNTRLRILINGVEWNGVNINSYVYPEGCRKTITTPNYTTKHFNAGDKLSFRFDDSKHFLSFWNIVHLEISNYTINDDDYKTELEYTPYRPYWKFRNNAVNNNTYYYSDGSSITVGGLTMNTDRLSYSYFGYYCNVVDMTIGDMLHSLQWIINAKVKCKYNNIYWDSKTYEDEVVGELDKLDFNSDAVGQKNFVRFAGEEGQPLVKINNAWLVDEKIWHESVFQYIPHGVIPQYTAETDKEGETTYKFNELSNPVLVRLYNDNFYPPSLSDWGLNRVNTSKEMTITIYNPQLNILNLDTINMDGRKYYVISGEKDLNKNIVKLKVLFIHNNIR